MKLEDLFIKLKSLGIPEERYYLHGLYGSTNDDDKLALIIKKEDLEVEYEVYFKERGDKQTLRIFSLEDDACEYFYKELKESQELENKFSR